MGMSSVHADMSGLSHLAHQILTAAGRHCLPLPNDAAVKQEPPPSQPRATPPLPCRRVGQTPQETLAGSSSTHPLELSESDADSSASSSVDPSQRVPAPWLHADTAASKRQEAAVGDGAVAAAHALLRQALQGSTLTSGHLRTKRSAFPSLECVLECWHIIML